VDWLGGLGMIQWTSEIYVSDNLKKKKDKAIDSINNRRLTSDIFCIAFASSPENLFDIINANELLFPHYQKAHIKILGLAKGEEEATKLAQDLLMEVYKQTGSFDVRNYYIVRE
jgi:hypothetical protein